MVLDLSGHFPFAIIITFVIIRVGSGWSDMVIGPADKCVFAHIRQLPIGPFRQRDQGRVGLSTTTPVQSLLTLYAHSMRRPQVRFICKIIERYEIRMQDLTEKNANFEKEGNSVTCLWKKRVKCRSLRGTRFFDAQEKKEGKHENGKKKRCQKGHRGSTQNASSTQKSKHFIGKKGC